MKKTTIRFVILTLFILCLVSESFSQDTVLVFRETFNALLSGEPNGKASTVDISSKINGYLHTPNWKADKAYSAGGTLKLGTSSLSGFIATPPLALDSNEGRFTLHFKLMAWNGDATVVKLWINDSLYWIEGVPNNAAYMFKSYQLCFSGGEASSVIRFEGKQPAKSRFFLEDFYVFQNGRQPLDTMPLPQDTAWSQSSVLALKTQDVLKTYRLESQVRLTAFPADSKKMFFVQDSSAAMLVYDSMNLLTSKLKLYSGLRGLEGKWIFVDSVSCFLLTSDTSTLVSVPKVVRPSVLNVNNLSPLEEGRLLQIRNLTLDSTVCLLPYSQLNLVQDSSLLHLWCTFENVDYFGDTLYSDLSYTLTGIYFQGYFCPRFASDFESVDPYFCESPFSLAMGGLTTSSVQLVWSGTADEYEVRLNDTSIFKTKETKLKLADLQPNAAYEWAVRSVCSSVALSAWVEGKSFTTKKAEVVSLQKTSPLEINVLEGGELYLDAREFLSVSVFDLQGKLLCSLSFKGGRRIRLNKKGVYFICYSGRLNGVQKIGLW